MRLSRLACICLPVTIRLLILFIQCSTCCPDLAARSTIGSIEIWHPSPMILIITGEVPPLIIVTTDDSFDDLDGAFIVEQIIPYLESHYRASPHRQHRAVAGGSLGGASAYHLAFKQPEIFESAGIFGNGAATGEEDDIQSWLGAIPEANQPARLHQQR